MIKVNARFPPVYLMNAVSSYRPISNLPVLSKLLERLVVRQLMDGLPAGHVRTQFMLTDCCQ